MIDPCPICGIPEEDMAGRQVRRIGIPRVLFGHKK